MASSDELQIKRNAASRALLRKSGIWRRGVGGTSVSQAPITCVYPLDDDGTLAASFSYGYAGPAAGIYEQTMSLTTNGGGIKVLMAADSLTTANVARGSAVIGYEAHVIDKGGSNASGLAFSLINSGGTVINAVTLECTANGDILQFEVAPDGVVTAKRNGVTIDVSSGWLNPSGQKTVGATDKFCPYLWVNDAYPAEAVEVALVTNAADMTGTYPAGTTDICGNEV